MPIAPHNCRRKPIVCRMSRKTPGLFRHCSGRFDPSIAETSAGNETALGAGLWELNPAKRPDVGNRRKRAGPLPPAAGECEPHGVPRVAHDMRHRIAMTMLDDEPEALEAVLHEPVDCRR